MNFSELREICKRKSGYIITLFVANELSLILTWYLRKTRISPNQVTIASIFIAICCACSYAAGEFIIGSVFLLISHVLDCTDGNLARVTGSFSNIGKWLDKIGDRFCETIILIGVSVYFLEIDGSKLWFSLSLFNGIFLLYYFYIVDIGLAMGISSPIQNIGRLKINNVSIIWGIVDPFIYGFIIFSSIGLVKVQIVFLSMLILIGIVYQAIKLMFISSVNSQK